MESTHALVVCLLTFSYLSFSATQPSVSTTVGEIIGIQKELQFAGEQLATEQYLGIPFAEPPVGKLRFQKPVPIAPFSETFRAVDFGPACPQIHFPGLPNVGKASEDCLFLNIYVPGDKSNKPSSGFPVMIWMHGGGFQTGSGRAYPSGTLSSFGEVIVVTINYRLGVLGFFNTGDKGALGNYGLWDQHEAIKWVNKNIDAFGGDPQKVTIFGESAGSMSVALQSLYPGNKGLFQRAIAESGGAIGAGMNKPNNFESAQFTAKAFGCEAEQLTDTAILDCLLSFSAEEILNKSQDFMSDIEKFSHLSLSPTIDNDFIKVHPFSTLQLSSNPTSEEEDMFASIDFMTGVNIGEGAVFVGPAMGVEDVESFVISREEMDNMYIPLILGMHFTDGYPPVLNYFVSAEYTDWSKPDDPVSIRDGCVDLIGDVLVNAPAVALIRKHANFTNSGKTFFYHFCPTPSKHLLPTGSWLKGANHGDELGFVFGFDEELLVLAEEDIFTPEKWEIEMSKGMMTMWTNFANTGDPNQPKDIEKYFNTAWPEFDTEGQKYLEIDRIMSKDSAKGNLHPRRMNFWLNNVPKLIDAFNEEKEKPADKYHSKLQESCSADGECSP